jgi:hypothetical protein
MCEVSSYNANYRNSTVPILLITLTDERKLEGNTHRTSIGIIHWKTKGSDTTRTAKETTPTILRCSRYMFNPLEPSG